MNMTPAVQIRQEKDTKGWALYHAAMTRGENAYREAGAVLLVLKAVTQKGEWYQALKREKVGRETARRLMLLAQSQLELRYADVCNPEKKSNPKPKEELPIRYDLMGRMVDAGFKALSKQSHPDAGGASATQAELSSARTRLREVIRAIKENKT